MNALYILVLSLAFIVPTSVSDSGSSGSGSGSSGGFRYLDTVKKFYTDVIYPNNVAVVQNRTKALAYFAPDLVARSRDYWGPEGFNLSITHMHGGSPPNPDTVTFYFKNFHIRNYVEAGKVAAVTVDYLQGITQLGQQLGLSESNLTHTDWFWFNGNDKIAFWDNEVSAVTHMAPLVGFDLSSRDVQLSTVPGMCNNTVTLCPSSVTGYTSSNPLQECIDYLTSLPHVGDFNSGAHRNTILCRLVSVPLAADPGRMCPAMGKLPNNFCTDTATYDWYYHGGDPFSPGLFIDH